MKHRSEQKNEHQACGGNNRAFRASSLVEGLVAPTFWVTRVGNRQGCRGEMASCFCLFYQGPNACSSSCRTHCKASACRKGLSNSVKHQTATCNSKNIDCNIYSQILEVDCFDSQTISSQMCKPHFTRNLLQLCVNVL
jgi:hypothetical protein